jgi:hypothetical protein
VSTRWYSLAMLTMLKSRQVNRLATAKCRVGASCAWTLACGALVLTAAAWGCSSNDRTTPTTNYGCKQQDNSCQCGDRAKVALIGDSDIAACPGTVPTGPYRCCRGSDRCVCEPYNCYGNVGNLCFCAYAIGITHPTRCLTAAQRVAEQSSDPGFGDYCCASPGSDNGGCRCKSESCDQSEVEVQLCSSETALAVCPTGTTEVTDCATES